MFAKNLKYLRAKRGYDQQTFAGMIHRSVSTISEWESGKYTPKAGILADIANIFGVKLDDMMNIDLSKNTNSKVIDQTVSTMQQLQPARQQKVYTYAEKQLKDQQNENVVPFPEQREIVTGRGTAAGAPIDGATQDAEVHRTRVNVDNIPASADEIVTVEGDSMEPDYPKYSQIFVRWQDTIDDGDLAVVRVADEGVTFKQVSRDYQQKKIVLHSLNDAYPDRYLDPEDVSIIGVVLN